MTTEQTIMARHEKRLALLACRAAADSRDQLIRESREAGLPVSEIALILGMSRGHVSRIISWPS